MTRKHLLKAKSKITSYLLLLRPGQWLKNIFLFAGLFFSGKLLEPASILNAIYAFSAFCFLSGAAYIINDLYDIEKDRDHIYKKKRPLPAGMVNQKEAIYILVLSLITGLSLSNQLGFVFLSLASGYIVLTIFYTYFLKKLALLDICAVALGFLIRTIAGTVAIGVNISTWLLSIALLLALFLALSKRKWEMMTIGDKSLPVNDLNTYSPKILHFLITTTAILLIVIYFLYAIISGQSRLFVLTLIPVAFGILRHIYIIDTSKDKNRPYEQVLVGDLYITASIFLWACACFYFIYLS